MLNTIDAHLHYVDFLQDSAGMTKLLTAMDKGHIKKAVLMGLPLLKKWDGFEPVEPLRYLDNDSKCYYYSFSDQIIANTFSSLAPKIQARFAPMICGFNPTDKHNIKHVEYLLEHYPFWKGLGEILLRHDSLTNITNEETARANHPAMEKIYQLCSDRSLPILLHHDSTAVGRSDIYEYVPELEEVLQQFPKLNLIWAHGGISENITHKYYHKMINDMLTRYSTLHVDLSWLLFDEQICYQGTIKKHWLEIIEKFSDRLVIGSDAAGNFDTLPQRMQRYDTLFNCLSPHAKQRIAYDNANALYFS